MRQKIGMRFRFRHEYAGYPAENLLNVYQGLLPSYAGIESLPPSTCQVEIPIEMPIPPFGKDPP